MLRLPLLFSLVLSAVPARAYDEIRFLEPIKLEEMARPVSIAASRDRIYLLDEKKSSLFLLDKDGRVLKSAGRSGSGKSELSGPKGVALSPRGRVFVADTGNSRIQILDADGNFQDSFGAKGSDPGQLYYPESVAVSADGRVFVSDTGNDRIQVFTTEGVFLFGFGEKGKGPGQMRSPTRIAVDASDFVYVLDSGNERILKFDPSTKFLKEFNLLGSDFALDPYGFIYITDPKAGKVKEQGPDGFILGAFGSKGTGAMQFKSPSAVAVTPDGPLLVLDPGNSRLQRIDLTNKLKIEPVPLNTASKLLVSGPSRVWPIKAAALAPRGDLVYAYLPEPGEFVALDRDGKTVLKFGKKGSKEGFQTEGSQGLAVSEKFGVYIADTEGDKMQRFNSSGTFLSAFAAASGFFDSKKKEGRVREPRGVAINEKGTVYVADMGNRRVDAFSPDGSFLFGFGPQLGPYEFEEPTSVAWDKAGFIYVLDRKLKKILKCEPSGGFVLAWGETGTGIGQFLDPVALAYDGYNYLYVLDKEAHRVSVFTKDGAWVTNFFAGGNEDRGLQEPEALAIQGDQLLVSDPAKGKVLSFPLHPRLAPPTAISTAAVEGFVELKWKAHGDPWAAQYRILRSSNPFGPFESVGVSAAPSFKDNGVTVYQTYHYRVAVEARTKDVGPASPPVAVFVPGAFNRAPIEISSVEIGNLLPANYKYYLKNPVGKVALVNNVNVPFQNVKLSFRLKDFMDFATESVLPKLEGQGQAELPLMATLNNHILEVTEDTPIQAEISLTYFESGKPHTVSIAKPLRVYSRNSIIWDKRERINAFVTSNDTPVLEFQKKVRRDAPALPPAAGALNGSLVDAVRLWSALGAAGVKFQQSPNNPFETMSQDPAFPVDYTQFPRETLKRGSGECDDLVTLLASMFEGSNVRTALLDYPGHIALMIDTGAGDALSAGLPESQMIRYNDTWWVPLEATLVGSSFVDAHRQALNAYREMAKDGRASVIDLRKAVATFEPVTMPATEWNAPTPEPAAVAKKTEADLLAYAKERYNFLKERHEEALRSDGKDVDALNQLGLLEVDQANWKGAEEQFGRVLAIEPDEPSALNNLGNVAFMKGDFAAAESRYAAAAAADAGDPGVWLNLAKTAAKRQDVAKAKEYGEKAISAAADSDKPRFKTAIEALTR